MRASLLACAHAALLSLVRCCTCSAQQRTLNYRGRDKVNTQWNLYCMVHNIEKLATTGYAQ